MNRITSPFSAFIFDMDGVLLDTEILYKKAAFAAAQTLGFEYCEKIHMATVGVPQDIGNQIIQEGMGPKFPLTEFDQKWRQLMDKEMAENVPVKSGVKDILVALEARNIPVGVATSSSSSAAHKHINSAGLKEYFQTIVTGDDITNGKPHPEPFLKAASQLGVDPGSAIAIEDSYNGIRSAHAAGMRVIMVPDLLEPTAEITALCHAIMPSMRDVHLAFSL